MDLFEENQNSLHRDMDTMGTRMDQLMETLHAVIKGQEELHQSVAKLDTAAQSTSANGRNDNANVETPTQAPRNDVDDHHNIIDLDEPKNVALELSKLQRCTMISKSVSKPWRISRL